MNHLGMLASHRGEAALTIRENFQEKIKSFSNLNANNIFPEAWYKAVAGET
jgi:hypothetical protein